MLKKLSSIPFAGTPEQEEQLKAVEWAKAEQKRLLKEKGECLSKELMEKMTPFILKQQKG